MGAAAHGGCGARAQGRDAFISRARWREENHTTAEHEANTARDSTTISNVADGVAVAPRPRPGWMPRTTLVLPRTLPAALGLLALGALMVIAAVSGTPRVGDLDLLLPAGLALMLALAYANGANDVSKAIATLVGSGVTDYRRAIAWGTVCTVLGGICSAFLASALIGTFTKGFIAAHAQQTETFALAVLLGALLWVVLATRIAMPVSTTHAITGALVTVGAVAYGAGNVQWNALVQKVAIPLALSPFLALAIALVVYLALRLTLARLSPDALNGLHWLSSGTASFARGLNDTPKIVALGVAFSLIAQHGARVQAPLWLFALAALGMGVGSLVGRQAVTTTLAEKVTRMDHSEGCAANLTTAVLVVTASNLGLPVSTTHVSAGAIIGIGLREGAGRMRWRVVRDMALAWLVTLPAAGALGTVIYLLLLLAQRLG
jgi:PiT family inorganic phosphate transporter